MRAQSPGYPNAALPKAIQSVRLIFDADRRNPIDRDLAARHIGYSGSSGAADKAIATLAHYGLTEKAGKGEVRVSQLALDIIHPDKPEDRKRALLQAAFNPQIFKDLRERFPEAAAVLRDQFFQERALERRGRLIGIPRDAPIRDWKEVEGLRVPALVVGNEPDRVHPLSYAVTWAERMPLGRFVQAPAKSANFEQHAQAVRAHVSAFLKSL